MRRFVAAPTSVATQASGRWAMTVINFPALSPTMEAGKLMEWTKKVGDAVPVGENFCKIETDKAVASFDNQDADFFFARAIGDVGSMIKVGDPLCLVVDDKSELESDEVKNWKPAGAAKAAPKAEPAVAAAPTPSPAAAPVAASSASVSSGDRVFASPLARVTAKALGVSLSDVVGTGGNVGRITKADVEAAAANPKAKAAAAPSAAAPAAPQAKAAAPPAASAYELFEDVPVSMMRSTIAKRLQKSINTEVPHFFISNDCKADSMLSTIKHLNAKGAGKYKITVNDYIIKAIARANLIVPACNSHWYGDVIRQYKNVDVSVAVATPTGLITPIIRNAQAKGLVEISTETKELAKRARDGLLQPNEYQGGTVTVSNMGGMGVDSFTAIINQPHSMILACGTASPKPEIIKNEEGEFVMTGKVEQSINFTASFDHRVVDGAVGAEWFKHFKDSIENPLSLLL